MSNLKTIINSIHELRPLAVKVIEDYPNHRIFIFNGQLGAGKTTFIKELCRELGVQDHMSSPTFGLVNEYHNSKGESIYHLDCYRLEEESEAWDIGLEEILDGRVYCFIEWPDKIMNLLPENYVRVDITLEEAQRRIFNFTAA